MVSNYDNNWDNIIILVTQKRNNPIKISLVLFKCYFMNQQNEVNIKLCQNIYII